MLAKRITLVLAALALTIPLTGCRSNRCCKSSSSSAPACCPAPGSLPPPGALPPAGF